VQALSAPFEEHQAGLPFDPSDLPAEWACADSEAVTGVRDRPAVGHSDDQGEVA
jgi:hypothetical protein